MQSMMRAAALLAALALVMTGCTARDRAGGHAAAETVELTFAQANDEVPDQLAAFAERVDRASRGALQIEFQNTWRVGEAAYEVDTIEDVRRGEVDMAWVGARAFDRLGMTAFQALLAPMLVDSHDLQGAVFDEGIPAQMMTGLDELGVVGVGVLPGPMRKLLSMGEPLTTPQSVAGLEVGIQSSALAEATFSALGATTVDLPSGADIGGIGAYEQQLASIWGNHYETEGGTSVAGNLNLWPRPLVIFIGEEAFGRLSEAQQDILRQAAADAVGPALEASRAEDEGSVGSLCAAGLLLPEAAPDELAALRLALQPVYDQITSDARSEEWLERIEQVKTGLGAPPDTASCDPQATPPGSTASGMLPEGTYQKEVTSEEWAAVGWTGATATHTMVIDANRLTMKEENGEISFAAPYEMLRDRLHTADGHDTVDATVRVDGDTIVFDDIDTGDCSDCEPYHVVWGGTPWVRAADAGNPLQGHAFRTSASADPECRSTAAGVVEVEFGHDAARVYFQPPGAERALDFSPEYSVFRDTLTVEGTPGGDPVKTWRITGDTLSLTFASSGVCADRLVWATQPWTEVA